MKNVGKIFESAIKDSIPDYCILIRLPDPPQSFTQRSDTRFSHKNPCDYICFDTESRIIYFFELKSVCGKSMSFEDVNDDNPKNRLIHKHQILGLQKFSEHKHTVSGFLLNFRDENNDNQRTYFLNIKDFNEMTKKINKASFNEVDLIMLGHAKKINGYKKRTRWYWNMHEFLESQFQHVD